MTLSRGTQPTVMGNSPPRGEQLPPLSCCPPPTPGCSPGVSAQPGGPRRAGGFPQSRGSQRLPSPGTGLAARVLAGCTTGAVAVACAQPTDVVKVRFQANGATPESARRYSGTVDAYRTIAREEGVRGLWRGRGGWGWGQGQGWEWGRGWVGGRHGNGDRDGMGIRMGRKMAMEMGMGMGTGMGWE